MYHQYLPIDVCSHDSHLVIFTSTVLSSRAAVIKLWPGEKELATKSLSVTKNAMGDPWLTGIFTYPRDPGSASENGFMEPKWGISFRRWVYTPSSSSDKVIGSLGLLNLPLKNQSYCWWFRNPAPVEVSSLSYYLQGFIHLRWYRISAINRWYISANYNNF